MFSTYAFSQGVISGRHLFWRSKNLKFLMLITSVRVNIQLNSAKHIRTFIRQFLKANCMGPIKIHNGGNYTHVQDYNAYKFFELKFS